VEEPFVAALYQIPVDRSRGHLSHVSCRDIFHRVLRPTVGNGYVGLHSCRNVDHPLSSDAGAAQQHAAAVMTQVLGDGGFGSVARQRIFRYAVLALACIFILRLGWLQIVQGGAYRLKAEAQAIKQIKIEPFRGIVYDRNGRAIVQNSPGFSIAITPYQFTRESCVRLASILGVSDSLVWAEVRKAAAYNKFNPAKISSGRDIDFQVMSAIEEQRDALLGVDVIIDPKRHYAFEGNASHLLGYTREVSEIELKELGDAYDPGDITGKSGLEKSYESMIRGQKGLQFVAVNNRGQRVSSFNEGKSDQPAGEGFDLYLGLDINVQVLAEKLMEGKRGGVVALDPHNGEVITFVSKPDFDLRQLTGRSSQEYLNTIFRDPEKPQFNRASMPTYPPGSTWKMMIALACLEEGLITPTTTLFCPTTTATSRWPATALTDRSNLPEPFRPRVTSTLHSAA
jgi:penicillin-binding protein 2